MNGVDHEKNHDKKVVALMQCMFDVCVFMCVCVTNDKYTCTRTHKCLPLDLCLCAYANKCIAKHTHLKTLITVIKHSEHS